jgi:hypothetical protein
MERTFMDAKEWTARKLEFWDAISVSHLTSFQKIVCWRLLTRLNRTHGSAWPSHATLADELQCNVRSVKRAVKAIADDGWFLIPENNGGRWFEGRGRANDYIPNWQRAARVTGESPLEERDENKSVDNSAGAGTRVTSVSNKGDSAVHKGDSAVQQGWSVCHPNPLTNPQNKTTDSNPLTGVPASDEAGHPDGWRGGFFGPPEDDVGPEDIPFPEYQTAVQAETSEGGMQGPEAGSDGGADDERDVRADIADRLLDNGYELQQDAFVDADRMVQEHGEASALWALDELIAEGKRGRTLRAAVRGEPSEPKRSTTLDRWKQIEEDKRRRRQEEDSLSDAERRARNQIYADLARNMDVEGTIAQALPGDDYSGELRHAIKREQARPGAGVHYLYHVATGVQQSDSAAEAG